MHLCIMLATIFLATNMKPFANPRQHLPQISLPVVWINARSDFRDGGLCGEDSAKVLRKASCQSPRYVAPVRPIKT